ncbi:MAG: helix-turn-helix domain-containing protein, partial [Bacteroidaceae bacterium]|nr:helix-turn-helix domain-containing protein [Bacteroidaceae bacterium]
ELSTAPVAFGQNLYCILEDSRGDLWLGAKPEGLTRLIASETGEGYIVKRYIHDESDPNSLSCNNIYDIVEDRQQRLWIATYKGGLNMYDLRQQHDWHDVFVHRDNGLSGWPADEESNKMRCLYITPEQVLMAGTLNGLYTCSLEESPRDMKFWHHCRRSDDAASLSYNWVVDIEPLRGHTVAIATSGGGFCLTDDRQLLSDRTPFNTFTTDQGLPSDVCLSLFFKPDHGLYIVSQTSISCFSLSDSTVTNYTRGTLGEHFKLLETKPVFVSSQKDSDEGSLLFGTTQGVLSVSPQEMQKSSYQPPLVFDCPSDIRLSSDERSLTIQFAALDFNKNVPITYAYRIEGMDNRWSYITDNHITLPDIPAGTFRLHLRSTNGDGVWADNEQTLTIHRRAAFHETPWAWMLYGLLLTLLVIGIYRVVRYIRRLQNEIKDIRLTSNQRIEVMSERIRELLSIKEAVEKVEPVEVVESEEDRLFAERVKTFVTAHLGDSNLSMQDFAQAMAISRTLLFARMKSVFNTSPNNYLLNQRIERAKELLRQPDVYVADVAYRSGFSDSKYFSKCFKKLTGMTPTEFQKS